MRIIAKIFIIFDDRFNSLIMKTMTTVFLLTMSLLFTTSCKKDTATICENLLEQGVANSSSLNGEWEFEYFAKTLNGKKITNKENISIEGKWIGFDNNNKIKGGICNALWGEYLISSTNNIAITCGTSTLMLCDTETNEFESRLLKALNNSQCFSIRDNELIIHYS